ncbi:MAG: acyl carrier protein [Ruminococcaceae bacterium]|nr:acyl carrier protein [Oscillospiraceae bacterium]
MVIDKVKEILGQYFDVDVSTLSDTTNIEEDLGADSVEVIDLILALEAEFQVEIPDEAADEIRTIGDLAAYIEEHA